MQKIKCEYCGRELPLEEFWMFKAPNREWRNHSSLEKPYHTCKSCCKYQLRYSKKDFQEILKELDIPYVEREWNLLQKKYPQSENWGRYICKMRLLSFYAFGYEHSDFLNTLNKRFKVIALVGKSGAGKDYIMHQMAEEKGWRIIVSSTTRPKRDYETEGVDYHFLTEKEFSAARFLETASFNGWHYGTRYEDLDPTRTNIGVFNPTGLKSLAAHDDIELSIIYVKASDKTRLLRQLNREEEPNVHEIVRRFYTDEADFQDDKSFISLGNSYHEVWNDDRVGQP